MTNQVATIFQFHETHSVRVQIENGEPLFHANDLCAVLEYVNPRDALRRHVSTEDVVKRDTLTKGGKQSQNWVLEAGMWALILGSETPKAKEVKRWVTSEVLPSIRRTGSYTTQQPAIETITAAQYHNLRIMVRSIAAGFHRSGSWEHWAWKHVRALAGGVPAAKLPIMLYDQAVSVLKALEIEANLYLAKLYDQETEFLRQDRAYLVQRVQMSLPLSLPSVAP